MAEPPVLTIQYTPQFPFARLGRAFRSPVASAYALRGRRRPDAIVRLLARRSEQAGLRGLRLIVSFDCDTDEDIAVAREVHQRMLRHGVEPVYAVPGELLERGAGVYGGLAAEGAEFINHGHREHTYFDADRGRYASCYFYDTLSAEEISQDIRRGDQTIRSVLGISPLGYRTPHFGTYQRPKQLDYLHGVLKSIGYQFSSSTVPLYGLRYGPMFSRFGLTEFPVTGTYSRPLEILDSWRCFAAPDRMHTPGDYLQECVDLVDALGDAGGGVLNLYADPSHVYASDEFFEAMEYCATRARVSSYGSLLKELA